MNPRTMATAFARLFVRDIDHPARPEVRMRAGIMGSITGVVINVLLAAAKFLTGALAGSVAITADAVNNLSDAVSSAIGLVSFRLSGKPADREHPFGHARMEYLAASAVAVAVLSVGLELLRTSYRKILDPAPVELRVFTVVVLVLSILAKLWLYAFNRGLGSQIGSVMLRAAAVDSLADVAATFTVLLSALISPLIGMQLDGYMGIAVALFILWSGIKILRETMNRILGQGPTEERVEQIESFIRGFEGVLDLHDLVVHDYGPGRSYASVHVEVDADVDILVSHDVADVIERRMADDLDIHLVIHLDPVVRNDPRIDQLRQFAEQRIAEVDPALTLHDFRVVWGRANKKLIFDVTAPYACAMSDTQIRDAILDRFSSKDHTVQPVIVIDRAPIEV
ncbi:MAG: cation transporter [Clostridiaceae bacterium]|nr:cation transporter [Clostridiaceae bacterium]